MFDRSPSRDKSSTWKSHSNENSAWKKDSSGGDRWNDRKSHRDRSPIRRGRERNQDNRPIRSDCVVYIANIPYDVRWMELKSLIREKAGDVNYVEMLEDRNGRSKGAAVVEFRDKKSVDRCRETLHRYVLKERVLSVKEIRDPVAFFRKVKEDTGVDFLNANGNPSDNRTRRDNLSETYGLSPAFLQLLHIDGPLTNRVFVSNLPYNLQSGRINEIFSLAGNVISVDLHLDKEGRSKGMAVVQFSHPIEAVQSISMLNNQRVFDRYINVKMDRFDNADEKKSGDLPLGLRSIGMGLGANGAPLSDIKSVMPTFAPPVGSVVHSNGPNYTHSYQPSQSSYQAPVPSSSLPLATPFVTNNNPQAATSLINLNSSASTGAYSTYPTTHAGYRTIIIRNLPQDYSWQIVRDRMLQFGPLENTEIISPGCAKVTFGNPADADRARKTLLNTTVEGRVIAVDLV